MSLIIKNSFNKKYFELWKILNNAIEETLRTQAGNHRLFPCIDYHMRFQLISKESKPMLSHSKRIRGVLFLMISKDLGIPLYKALPIACAVEIMHNASLIIDDIQDEDIERCEQPALWCLEGKKKALIVASLLLDEAHYSLMKLCSSEKFYATASDVLELTSMLMEVGQSKDIMAAKFWSEGLKEYFKIIGAKTAIATANIWALATLEYPPDYRSKLIHNFGYSLGLAHQFEDDLDDLIKCKSKSDLNIDVSNVAYFLASELGFLPNKSVNDIKWLLLENKPKAIYFRHRLLMIRHQLQKKAQTTTKALPLSSNTIDDISIIVQMLLHRNDDAIKHKFH